MAHQSSMNDHFTKALCHPENAILCELTKGLTQWQVRLSHQGVSSFIDDQPASLLGRCECPLLPPLYRPAPYQPQELASTRFIRHFAKVDVSVQGITGVEPALLDHT